MSHAKLSPSAAERWMTCPGSVVLSAGMPQKTSAFAEEGTCAHALAETCLLDRLPAQNFVGKEFTYEDHGKIKTVVIEQVMADNVQVYIDAVTALPGEMHVEVKVSVNEEVYGTADAVVWDEETRTLYVRDLKYGAGVAVEVPGNLQLKIYATAALITMRYPAEVVDVGICQPRCPHSDGPVRSITFDVVDLVDFHADLLDAIDRVEESSVTFVGRSENESWRNRYLAPSEKGCRWCLASPKCPALKSKAQTMAKQVFIKGSYYDPKELAETLDMLPILEGWIKNVREFAYEEAERGAAIPDWKLVEKRATRKWRMDEAATVQELHKCGLNEEIFERKLITPAAAEKLLPKEQRALLDELCVKESSGHTLVHASDKREAIKVDAKSAFANS